ncbi:MAG: CPBP family intramembrane glutamic endopeptidase [Sphingomonas sp.]
MKASAMNPAAGAFVVLGAAAAAGLAIILGAQFIFGRILEVPSIAALSPVLLESVFTITVFGLLALVAGLAIRLSGDRIAIGPAAPLSVVAGVAAGICGLGIAIALSAVAGAVHAGQGAGFGLLLLAGTGVTLLQTSAEELYFRGWLQPRLQGGWGRWPGLAVTSLAFSALHFVSGDFDMFSFVNLTLAGVWFGLLAERSGGLALPIGAHFGWNWAEEMLFGATPNPGVSNFGTVFDWDLTGAANWGGSAAGLNASLSATFVLLALVVVSASWRGWIGKA